MGTTFQSLQDKCFVMDAHCDTALRLAAGESLRPDHAAGHVDLPRLKTGKVDVQVFALWVNSDRYRRNAVRRCLTLLDAVWREVESHPEDVYAVLSGSDFSRAREENKIGVLLSIEDGAALGGSLAALRMFYRLGVRAVGLTWNGRNELADGVGVRDAGGLTPFGKAAVAEMDRLGIVVDVSHLAERGFWDVVDTSERPFIASHSNAKSVCNHVRNLSDVQMKELAARGGVIGINFCPPFLAKDGRATVADVVAHMEYMFELVGPEHVGIGSDYDGIRTTPKGLEDVARLPRLTEALLRRGHTEQTIAGVLGLNFRRVFTDVLSHT